jgi:hypothetical protein
VSVVEQAIVHAQQCTYSTPIAKQKQQQQQQQQ